MPSYIDAFACVRLERIVIDSIKGVEHGEISFINPRRPEGASVVGLYGQNGSGKSTIIDVLEMVRSCIAGGQVRSRMAGYVDVAADHGRVQCDFSLRQPVCDASVRMRVSYAFGVKGEQSEENGEGILTRVFDESIAISVEDEPELRRMTRIIDTSKGPVFGPASKARRLVGSGRYAYLETRMNGAKEECVVDLSEAKQTAYRESLSFIFRDAGIDGALVATCFEQLRRTEDGRRGVLGHELGLPDSYYMPQWCIEAMLKRRDEVDTLPLYAYIALDGLRIYGTRSMHILNSSDAGNALAGTLSLPMANEISHFAGHLADVFLARDGDEVSGLRLDGPTKVNGMMYRSIRNMLRTMNLVMEQVIPGLSIELAVIDEKQESFFDGGEEFRKTERVVRLYSRRGERRLPFECESGGVKRMVSFINYLVVMYNDPYTLVAIDEIDSGVFEYLLGELLSIVCDQGVGQLVFTSHNLRPLETIDRGYIWFTTTNPKNRYVRMSNVKTTNNLRDFYYRSILLGGQKEQLYDPTNNGEIELALMEAGMCDDAE